MRREADLLQGDQASVLLRPARVLSLRLLFDLFKLRIGLVIGFTAITGLAVASGRSLRDVAREEGVDEAVIEKALDYRAMTKPHG